MRDMQNAECAGARKTERGKICLWACEDCRHQKATKRDRPQELHMYAYMPQGGKQLSMHHSQRKGPAATEHAREHAPCPAAKPTPA